MVRFQKNLYFWNENKKLDWMDPTNVQNLRKNSNANVLQIFAFALQMWVTIWAGKPDDKRNIFTLWQEFRSQCRGQIQMNTLIIFEKKLPFTTLVSDFRHIWMKPNYPRGLQARLYVWATIAPKICYKYSKHGNSSTSAADCRCLA